eukprot:1194870-Prorocentrum_minimum.AAC.5
MGPLPKEKLCSMRRCRSTCPMGRVSVNDERCTSGEPVNYVIVLGLTFACHHRLALHSFSLRRSVAAKEESGEQASSSRCPRCCNRCTTDHRVLGFKLCFECAYRVHVSVVQKVTNRLPELSAVFAGCLKRI